MNCSETKDRLNLLADNELDKIERKKVLAHIMACKECHDEYNTILEMEKIICSSIQLDDLEKMDLDIKNKNITNRRRIFMKRKVITASIALMLLVGTFVPVKGQSLASNIQQWVKSLSFKTDETDYTISADLEIPENIIEHPPVHAEEENPYLKVYSNIEDIPKDLGYNIQLPEYIPEGYTFSKVEHYTFDEGKTNNIVLNYSNPEINGGGPSLFITNEFIKTDIPKREIRHSEGTELRSIEVNNYPAFFSYFESSNTVFIDLCILVNNGDQKTVCITMLAELEKAELINAEEELIKIAKSILD